MSALSCGCIPRDCCRTHFQFLARLREVEPGRLATIDVKGDFDGHAVIAARQHDDSVELAFDWHVVVRHPWIAPLTRVMPGVFVRNHRWVMAQGQSALQLRLVQRRGPVSGTPTHSPPKPSFPHNFRFVRDLYSWRRSFRLVGHRQGERIAFRATSPTSADAVTAVDLEILADGYRMTVGRLAEGASGTYTSASLVFTRR